MEMLKNSTLLAISTVNHSVTGNSTSYGVPLDRPIVFVVVRIAIASVAFCLNSAVLIFHLFKPAYATDFTTYLLFLYFANSVYLIGSQPLRFWSDLSLQDIGSFGRSVCTVYNYLLRVVSVIPVMCHVLIALNRLWAVQYPIHYRDKHSRKTALLICLGMVVYVHIANMIPFFIYLPYRYQAITETTGNCKDAYNLLHWSRADNILNRFAPLFVIIVVYIYLTIKRFLKHRTAVIAATNGNNTTLARTGTTGYVSGDATRKGKLQRRSQRTPVFPLHRKVVRPFLVLTLTTAEVVVCWLLLDIIYFCQLFLGITILATAFQVFTMLFAMQILFDPLMWMISLRFRRDASVTVIVQIFVAR